MQGVKCLDMNQKVFLTGSYDSTFKVWRRDDWTCVKATHSNIDDLDILVNMFPMDFIRYCNYLQPLILLQ